MTLSMYEGTHELTPEEKAEWILQINGMSQFEMARLMRFAPSGHPLFDNRTGLYPIFKERFAALGGMTPAISKALSD